MPEPLTLWDVAPELNPYPSLPGATIDDRFRAFHKANPWVYDALVRLARDMVARGHTRVGIGMLYEVLRWQYARATDSTDPFKLNNNWRSRYARLIARNCPDLAGVFEMRELKSP